MDVRTTNPQGQNTIKRLLDTYRIRQSVLVGADLCFILISFLSSMMLTGSKASYDMSNIVIPVGIYMVLHISIFTFAGCYRSLWRYAGVEEALSIVLASLIYAIPCMLLHKIAGYKYTPLFYIVNTIFIIASTGGFRLAYRTGRKLGKMNHFKYDVSNVLLVGAGTAGHVVINEIKDNPQMKKRVVGILDDDKNKTGRKIHNIKILGTTDDVAKIVEEKHVDEIIIAMANITKEGKKKIIEKCQKTKCKLKTLPGIYEIIDGKVDIKKIRDVDIEDLLGREPIKTNLKEVSDYVQGRVVLVTGGGGSIGSELCRQIATFKPKHLIIVDNYENNAYSIQQELIRKYGKALNLSTIIASVREEIRIEAIFKEYNPEVVFHAAAHKHVPLMEKSPSEAIKNNIFGTMKVAMLADKYKVRRFVLISTDKAVNPTNIMGATKRAAEMIIQTFNEKSKTEYVAVRFGNVLGSNGSVIPLFKKQIEEGGPVTITHPDIIRYFMTIPEAVGLVIQAGAMAKGGEVFILDMGEPVKILDLANNLIKLSGFEPGEDISIKFTGLRPGEKLYEELLMSEEGITSTENKKIFIGKPIDINTENFKKSLDVLKKIIDKEDIELIDSVMRQLVDTYIRPEEANKKEVI
ncbi:polysaccharide biosynthesis protein [Terrisporobacter mayombei]|uniref:UDP-N-acetyl-alpha-D-glucosamine C6 dehydratase n=1 Tax=Terrisporobacter mayombei TaxID=1541 RepID=A0ABY9Q792_9FIRM|nr:nucleoside-diphosphate sugar epimerase/dehydratase [Terrisporobacter mayombei]MCC3869617.1 polysaccharide biosynthesis protein [Terrisporobacter mayombei]WMT83444.1 UDP-N-acetyl-alpha-D-glucosamine C6 dehydratase [Terrisporobacter mayombei]